MATAAVAAPPSHDTRQFALGIDHHGRAAVLKEKRRQDGSKFARACVRDKNGHSVVVNPEQPPLQLAEKQFGAVERVDGIARDGGRVRPHRVRQGVLIERPVGHPARQIIENHAAPPPQSSAR